jgi:hypothetical protein
VDGTEKYADFERRMHRRNRVELACAAVCVVGFAVFLVILPLAPLARACMIASMASAPVIAWVLHRHGSVRPLPDALEPGQAKELLRSELRRQAQLLQWAPAWYVLPLLAPAPIFFYAVANELGEPAPVGLVSAVLLLGSAVAVMNVHAARKLRQEADALA